MEEKNREILSARKGVHTKRPSLGNGCVERQSVRTMRVFDERSQHHIALYQLLWFIQNQEALGPTRHLRITSGSNASERGPARMFTSKFNLKQQPPQLACLTALQDRAPPAGVPDRAPGQGTVLGYLPCAHGLCPPPRLCLAILCAQPNSACAQRGWNVLEQLFQTADSSILDHQ